ncbi:MAG: hypothetical protein N3E38_02275 [Candidatus Aenigmarchaeota archaeon]|nr:hypothetical protein [Candidatus Aenigmarchaeota archaeon]
MKKLKLDRKSILLAISMLLIGFGIGLIFYPRLSDWMPLASGVIILLGVFVFFTAKK